MHDIFGYSYTIGRLRKFFQEKHGFIEVPVQSRLSILAACEDPKTIQIFNFNHTEYPLPQTGQMWLEHELLNNPNVPGVFCISTSYRDEPNPIPGRHDKIFPMFEFEFAGTIHDLRRVESELLTFLGMPKPVSKTYEELAKRYQVSELTAVEESKMTAEFNGPVSLEYFPLRTHPFWNMKQNPESKLFNKIDVIINGLETIGSAERETDIATMRQNFHRISDGEYARLLFEKFGEARVLAELEDYFRLNFFPRVGAGIGVTRLVKAMYAYDLIPAIPEVAVA